MTTKLEQVARLCAVVSRDAGGPYPETVDDPCGGLIDRDEALSAATIDNREAYARGVEDAIRTIEESASGIGVTDGDTQIKVALQRLEAMKNGK
jgi:hypothetical protein